MMIYRYEMKALPESFIVALRLSPRAANPANHPWVESIDYPSACVCVRLRLILGSGCRRQYKGTNLSEVHNQAPFFKF